MRNLNTVLIFLLFIFATCNAQDKIKEVAIRLENYEYPFPVNEMHLKVQGQDLVIAFMDIPAQNPNGKTVLLLHGKNFAGNYWEQTAKDLSISGFRVIIPDQVGFGKSSKPENIQYTFQLLALNTKTLLDKLQIERTSVIGHSMGGMLAIRFVLMYPQFCEKLIVENPIGLEDWKTVVPYQSVDDWYAAELKQNYEKLKAYQLEFYYGGKWKPEYEKWLEIPAGWTRNKDYPVIAKTSALTYDMIFTQPIVYEFENITVPTLLIIGQRDRTALGKAKAPKDVQEKLGNYPELGRAAAKRIKNSQLIELDNVGHLPHIEDYRRFITPILKFLRN
ncbi:MAG TPA: alpha/beta hydrolase [Flavobacterium sp.]